MSRALSVDVRDRVIRAISGGMSRRQAAARFEVSASSAVRWYALLQASGDARPKALGGDRRSSRIEGHARVILDLSEKTPDMTLAELRSQLAERGIGVGLAPLWRFFERRKITLKKSRRTRRSRTAQMS